MQKTELKNKIKKTKLKRVDNKLQRRKQNKKKRELKEIKIGNGNINTKESNKKNIITKTKKRIGLK